MFLKIVSDDREAISQKIAAIKEAINEKQVRLLLVMRRIAHVNYLWKEIFQGFKLALLTRMLSV